jgi:hypothetical protein
MVRPAVVAVRIMEAVPVDKASATVGLDTAILTSSAVIVSS